MRIHDGFLTMIPSVVALLPAIPISVWILRRGEDRRWTLLTLLAVLHVSLLIALTIFPIPIAGQDYYRQTRGMGEDNVIPFATILSQITHPGLSSSRQLFGNVVALTPLAVYGPGLWPALRDPRRFAALAVAVAVAIELTQYAGSTLEGFTYRVTDVDDAIMNATGAIAAFFVWRRLEPLPLIRRWLAPGRAAPIGPATE
jgi:glycopeptide antibiotics resistance protein